MKNEQNILPEDEIDFKSIGQRILKMSKYPFLLFNKNRFITLLFIILSVLTSVAIKFLVTKTYSSSFIIRPNDKTEKFHLRMLEDIRSLLKHKDWQTMSQCLNLDSITLKQIVDLEIYNSTTKPAKDSINYTEVVIETSNYNLLIPFQDSLLNYLENNPYFNKIRIIESNRMAKENPQVDKDLAMLDTLKKLQIANYANQKSQQNSSILLSDVTDPIAFYSLSIDRMNNKYRLIAQKAFINNFQLIKSCVVVKKPTWPPRILILICFTLPVFLFFCFIFLHQRSKPKK